MPTPPPRPALAVPATIAITRRLLGATLLALPLAVAAQRPPATPDNAKILTPSVSNEDPNFGGKSVISSTTGPVSPARTPITAPLPAASGPTSMSASGSGYSTGAGTTTVTMPAGSYGAYGAGTSVEVMPRGAVAMPAAGRPGAVVVPDASTGPAYAPVPVPLPVPSYGRSPAANPPYTRTVVTGGDVLVMPDGGTVTTVDTVRRPANVPRKGSTMAQVRADYGSPQSEYKTGGGSRAQPPITRWNYPGFNVVFEYTHVVDVVVPSAPPPLVRTSGLSAMPVNPANPKYKGVPGRALRP